MEIIRRPVPPATGTLAEAGVHPVLARVLAARGITTTGELDHGLERLPPFSSLKGIDAAAARLADAVGRREPIVIVADYDADGATACALAVQGLRALGAEVDFLVPNRFEYGYGLTPEIVRDVTAMSPRLLVTVDNGIASHEGVAAAAAAGIDVLITDHHLPAASLPTPALIVNPNQGGCDFPSRHLAGVGVVFYVLLATRACLRQRGAFSGRPEPNFATLLDLVALGTVADVVRIDRVNRALVSQGLARIRGGRARPGITALFNVAGRDPARATAGDLGFVVGPRLNAAGRLADMSVGIRCLLAPTTALALPLAAELDRLNRERREVEATMQDEALAALAADTVDAADACTLCLFKPDWHPGVVGIVAARLKDRFHRPVIVFARSGAGKGGRGGDAGDSDSGHRNASGELRGSGRSIPGLHLRDALDLVAKRAPGLLRGFGGHAFAAGLTLAEVDLPRFVDLFETIAQEALTPAHLRRTVESDGSLAPAELDLDLAELLRDEVWGQGFPPPLFDDVFTVAEQSVVGAKHLRLVLERIGVGAQARYPAILFNQADRLPTTIRAAYRPEVNEWRGSTTLQLLVEHWWPA